MLLEKKCVGGWARPVPKDGSRDRCRPCQQAFDKACKVKAQKDAAQKPGNPARLARYAGFFYWKKQLVGLYTGADWNSPLSEKKPVYHHPQLVFVGYYEPEDAPDCQRLKNLDEWGDLPRSWVKQFKATLKRGYPLVDGKVLDWDGVE